MADRLPIYEIEPEIIARLKTNRRIVIEAPTGSGKSTQVPQILLRHGFLERGQVVVLQPRRLEAIRQRPESKGFVLLPLHGELPPVEQDAVVARYDRPKVVVSTNVAETSLTIDGVRLVIDTQNGAATKLFVNTGAQPGLRVRLTGPPGNPTGVGAVLRPRFGSQWGPAREIRAGSGYWSQDNAVQVLGCPTNPTQVQVRWPGGKTVLSTVPTDAREIWIDPEGQVRKLK